jgi:hypothetical protein
MNNLLAMLNNLEESLVRLLHVVSSASRLTYASVGVGLAVAFLYFRLFFKDLSGFAEDSKNVTRLWPLGGLLLLFRPDAYDECQWSRLKLLIWLGLSVGCGVLAYYQLPVWFPRIFA